MGSLVEEEEGKRTTSEAGGLVVTQVSLGGFDGSVSARELTDFLEMEAGLIWRCRVKTSWTPPGSYPDYFRTAPSSSAASAGYAKVVPHAFVHFASPGGALRAMDAAGRGQLILGDCPLCATCGPESSLRLSRRRKTTPFRFNDARVEIGTVDAARSDFLVTWRGPDSGLDFLVDPFDGCCRLVFARDTAFSFKGTRDVPVIRCDFKVEFSVRDIKEVRVYSDRAPFSLLVHVVTAPQLYYRTADDDIYVSVPYNLLDDDDPWIRTTDFTRSGAVGRCSFYRISYSLRFWPKMELALAYMRDRRVKVTKCGPKDALRVHDEPDFGQPMSDLFFCVQHAEGIRFPVLFLVNALVHDGILNQRQVTPEFFVLLRKRDDTVNIAALRDIFEEKHPVNHACRRLERAQDRIMWNTKVIGRGKLGDGNVEVRRLIVTPTKAYCMPPAVEISNRVLRHYHEVADRFLRVTFTDEGTQQLNSNALSYSVTPIVKDLTSTWSQQKTTVFERVKTFLTEGFHLCGRKYSFLAFSSNQLRDRSAWFFAEDSKTTVAGILKWMGRFSNKNVAKCAARMGQCFSSTYATVNIEMNEVIEDLPDVERNGYVFSDGIGKISPDLALEVAKCLQLTENHPSAYQIRYAGFKGVVAVWKGAGDGIRLFLRRSMRKFESNHTVLEVVSWTRFQPGFLNRQIITLLSSLNVPDAVFAEMQESMILNLNSILVDTDVAFEVLTTSCAEQGNTAAMMLSAGFKPEAEPHLKAMLSAIRSTQLRDLLSKTRIFVPKGRWLMGCLDELGVLDQGQCYIQASTPSLKSCFVKHGSNFSAATPNMQIIVGTVTVAKNPCLHPGDIRVLEAIDVPELHHLVDCLVFPQKGERPHANEASGSDLDGDLYFVTWDENLVPPGKKSWPPMDYTPANLKELPRAVSSQDIIDFFLKNMVTENLGVICNAHVVHSDISEYGAMDKNCIHLAELAATAVDFPKTGRLVSMPPSLRPKLYPDFMGKEDHMSYKSEKILGRLYREIRCSYNDDSLSEAVCTLDDLPYDPDLEVPGASDYLASAWQFKCSYDVQLNGLLSQYGVRTEGELVTGHICPTSKHNSRKQGEIKEKLKNAYSALRKEVRSIFESTISDSCEFSDDEKNILYEQKASAWYQVTYHPKWIEKSREMVEPDGGAVPARLSFPWIAADYLVRIKLKCHGRKHLDTRRPVDALSAYISERI